MRELITPGDDGVIDSIPTGDDILVEELQEHYVLTRFHDVEADVNAGRTLSECDFRISVGTFTYDMTLLAGTSIPCYYAEYIVDTNNLLQ